MTKEKLKKIERQKQAARLRRQRKPKPDAFTKWDAQAAKFFELPLEIRDEIYRLVFLSMTNVENDSLYVFVDRTLKTAKHVTIERSDGPGAVPILPILQTCKQMHHEARQVFWSSMTFVAGYPHELESLCEAKQMPHRRHKKTLPSMFPVDRIRHLFIAIDVEEDFAAHVLKALWALAKVASSHLEPEIDVEPCENDSEVKFEGDGAAMLAVYRQIKEYQAWRKQQGLPLDVDRFNFYSWIKWNNILDFYARMPKTKAEEDEMSFE